MAREFFIFCQNQRTYETLEFFEVSKLSLILAVWVKKPVKEKDKFKI